MELGFNSFETCAWCLPRRRRGREGARRWAHIPPPISPPPEGSGPIPGGGLDVSREEEHRDAPGDATWQAGLREARPPLSGGAAPATSAAATKTRDPMLSEASVGSERALG